MNTIVKYETYDKSFVNFKDFHDYSFKTLTESPVRTGKYSEGTLDHKSVNSQSFTQWLKDKKIEQIDTWNFINIPFKIYRWVGGTFKDSEELLIVDDRNTISPLIVGVFDYHKTTKDTITETGVWKMKGCHQSIMQYFYLEYLLNKWQTILSDDNHSTEGENFWRHLFTWCLDKKYNHKPFIFNTITHKKIPITNLDTIDLYYGTDKHHWRLGLEK